MIKQEISEENGCYYSTTKIFTKVNYSTQDKHETREEMFVIIQQKIFTKLNCLTNTR